MKTTVFFTALMLSAAFTGYAGASGMMDMSIPEFIAWGWRR